jgi:hypothetical protein
MNKLAKTLEEIILAGLNNTPLPYKKGSSIRIGPVVIRKSKTHGYIIFDCENQKSLATTFSRVAALAIAKHYKDSSKHTTIISIDNKIQKFYNDSLFYQNTINKTNDVIKKEITEDRLELANAEIQTAQCILEDIIFNE